MVQSRYLPYGQERWTDGPAQTDFTFTGQRADNYTHLIEMGARWYDPQLNRWISADSIVPQASNPQAWNRYAYVANNPLRFNDPTGHCWGIASGLRNTVYGQTCENLDLAGIIVASPDATAEQKIEAGGYIGVTAGAHIALAIGLGGIACGLNPACDAAVGTALGFGASGAGGPAFGQTVQAADTSLSGQAAAGAVETSSAIPLGFTSATEFQSFGDMLKGGLSEAGYNDVAAAFQGSSVTGVKYTTGAPFDVGRVSDFDIALSSPDLFERAQNLGIELRGGGVRTGPLGETDLAKLGLYDLREKLSGLAGRDVNFMIFKTIEAATDRSPSIVVP